MQTQPVPLSAVEDPLLKTHLLDSVEQAVLAVDQTGRIVFWNRFAEKLLGWTLEEVQGRSINHVLAAPQLLETALINLNRLQSGEGWSGEFLVQHLDRTSFMAHIHTSLVQNEQRSLLSMVIIPQDNSERQPLQEANRLLAEAGARLMDVVDYEAPLTTLVQLAVPQIADWCAVHLLRADGSLEQVVLAPV